MITSPSLRNSVCHCSARHRGASKHTRRQRSSQRQPGKHRACAAAAGGRTCGRACAGSAPARGPAAGVLAGGGSRLRDRTPRAVPARQTSLHAPPEPGHAVPDRPAGLPAAPPALTAPAALLRAPGVIGWAHLRPELIDQPPLHLALHVQQLAPPVLHHAPHLAPARRRAQGESAAGGGRRRAGPSEGGRAAAAACRWWARGLASRPPLASPPGCMCSSGIQPPAGRPALRGGLSSACTRRTALPRQHRARAATRSAGEGRSGARYQVPGAHPLGHPAQDAVCDWLHAHHRIVQRAGAAL